MQGIHKEKRETRKRMPKREEHLLCIKNYTIKCKNSCAVFNSIHSIGILHCPDIPFRGLGAHLHCGKGWFRFAGRAVGLSELQEADMPSFRAADTIIQRLFADKTIIHVFIIYVPG